MHLSLSRSSQLQRRHKHICLETYSKWSHSVKDKEFSVLRWNFLAWWWIISDSEQHNAGACAPIQDSDSEHKNTECARVLQSKINAPLRTILAEIVDPRVVNNVNSRSTDRLFTSRCFWWCNKSDDWFLSLQCWLIVTMVTLRVRKVQ